jgi:hypothetical protein
MATTTNYSWTTPDDTDLVKDGAAAIRTLGSSADTTVKALNPGTTAGDIDYYTAATTKARIAIGTAGQVLTVNSGATAPEWALPAPGGGLTLITETVASTNSSISFTGISGSYKQLLLVWQGIQHSISGSKFTIRLNNDSSALYSFTQSGIENQTATSQELNNQTDIGDATNDRVPFGLDATGSTYSLAVKGQLLIDNYASTSKFKYFDVTWGNAISSTSNNKAFRHYGTYRSTSAITSVDIVRLTGSATLSNLSDTSIRLYGIS